MDEEVRWLLEYLAGVKWTLLEGYYGKVCALCGSPKQHSKYCPARKSREILARLDQKGKPQ